LYTSENIPVPIIKHQDVSSSPLQQSVDNIAGRQIAMYLNDEITTYLIAQRNGFKIRNINRKKIQNMLDINKSWMFDKFN
jgi:hypothetical protein